MADGPPAQEVGGFDSGTFSELAALEERSFWFQGRARVLAWVFRRYFPQATSMLEVGCGNGYLMDHLHKAFPALELTGCDLFPEGLEIARRRMPGVRLDVLDARRLPFDQDFDVVGAFDVLEHVDEDVEALDGMYRAVRPGGGLLVAVPQHRRLWSAWDEAAHHVRRYGRAELTAKVRQAGFEVVRVTSYVSFLLPLMLLSRRRRSTGPNHDPYNDAGTPAAFQRLLGWGLRVDEAVMRAGVSLPAGGSLLLMGRRPPSSG